MRENLAELGFTVLEGLSADMEDLPTEKSQNEAVKFFEYVLWQIRNAEYKTICPDKRIVVVIDCQNDNQALNEKIDLFIESVNNPVDIVNIVEFPFKGSCQGCFHSMGSRFKMYDDRQFCNGHRTVTMGTPFGYIIDGDINAEPNLKKVLIARAQVGGMKIFRDLIYQMRGMMRADHKFFKSHGQYDFPHKKWSTSMKMYLVGWMMNNKKVRSVVMSISS